MEFRDVVPEVHEGYMADMNLGEPYIPTELPGGDATDNYGSFIDLETTFGWYDPLEGLGHGSALNPHYNNNCEILGGFLSSGAGDIAQGYSQPCYLSSGASPASINILDRAYEYSPAPSTHSHPSSPSPSSSAHSPATLSSLASPLSCVVEMTAAAPPAILSPASPRELGSSTLQLDRNHESLSGNNGNLIPNSNDSMGLSQILITKGRVDLLDGVISLVDDINATKTAGTDAAEIASKRFSPYFDTISIRHTERQPAKRFQCVFCAYHISNRTQVVQHLMRRHFFYSPYRCVACESSFCRQADLKKHTQDKHSGRRFRCSCGKTYTNDRNRRRHQERSPSCSSDD